MRTDNEFEFLKLSRADIRQLALCVKRGYLPYDVEPSQVLLDKFLIVDGWAETGPIYTPTNDVINYLAFLARKRRDSRRFCIPVVISILALIISAISLAKTLTK